MADTDSGFEGCSSPGKVVGIDTVFEKSSENTHFRTVEVEQCMVVELQTCYWK